jgi:hypothetical protein
VAPAGGAGCFPGLPVGGNSLPGRLSAASPPRAALSGFAGGRDLLHRVRRDFLELLRQRAPPLQRIDDFRAVGGLAVAVGGGLAGGRLGGLALGCTARRGLDLHGLREVGHAHVHALERGQRHLLHFQRLDGGAQGRGVLLQPELHGLELPDALVQLLDVERGCDPAREIGHLRHRSRSALREVLEEIEPGDELAEAGLLLGAHGDAPE